MPTLLQANGEIVSLPTFKTMAESELRAETGVIPYQQDENIRKACSTVLFSCRMMHSLLWSIRPLLKT